MAGGGKAAGAHPARGLAGASRTDPSPRLAPSRARRRPGGRTTASARTWRQAWVQTCHRPTAQCPRPAFRRGGSHRPGRGATSRRHRGREAVVQGRGHAVAARRPDPAVGRLGPGRATAGSGLGRAAAIRDPCHPSARRQDRPSATTPGHRVAGSQHGGRPIAGPCLGHLAVSPASRRRPGARAAAPRRRARRGPATSHHRRADRDHATARTEVTALGQLTARSHAAGLRPAHATGTHSRYPTPNRPAARTPRPAACPCRALRRPRGRGRAHGQPVDREKTHATGDHRDPVRLRRSWSPSAPAG